MKLTIKTMQRLRILVILILLSLMPLYSLAVLNEGQYAFRSLDINNGLSQNTVHAILQDKQGFMWFGRRMVLTGMMVSLFGLS